MKKWLILLLIILTPLMVNALPMCEKNIEISTNCTMLTPSLTCATYNYTIFVSDNGSIAEMGNLSLFAKTIYQFNFTLTEYDEDYIVELCDMTTREVIVRVEDEGNMILFGLMILPLILGIFFLVGAAILDKTHVALKIGLFLASIPTFFAAGHIGLLGLIRFYPEMPELQNWVGTTTFWSAVFFWVLILYFVLYTIAKITLWMVENKKKKDEEMMQF